MNPLLTMRAQKGEMPVCKQCKSFFPKNWIDTGKNGAMRIDTVTYLCSAKCVHEYINRNRVCE